jgi:hypothetical protein
MSAAFLDHAPDDEQHEQAASCRFPKSSAQMSEILANVGLAER